MQRMTTECLFYDEVDNSPFTIALKNTAVFNDTRADRRGFFADIALLQVIGA